MQGLVTWPPPVQLDPGPPRSCDVNSRRKVYVLGPSAADNPYEGPDPVGSPIQLRRVPSEIIGPPRADLTAAELAAAAAAAAELRAVELEIPLQRSGGLPQLGLSMGLDRAWSSDVDGGFAVPLGGGISAWTTSTTGSRRLPPRSLVRIRTHVRYCGK